MSTSVRFFVEYKSGDTWERAEKPYHEPFRRSHDEPAFFFETMYEEKNIDIIAMAGGLCNNRSYPVFASTPGIPTDASLGTRAEFKASWASLHSIRHISLSGLLEYPWEQEHTVIAYVPMSDAGRFEAGHPPRIYCFDAAIGDCVNKERWSIKLKHFAGMKFLTFMDSLKAFAAEKSLGGEDVRLIYSFFC